MIRVAIDMDAIVANLLGKWLRVYNEENGDDLGIAQIGSFDVHLYADPEVGKGIYNILERPGFFDDVDVIPGAIDGVRCLRDIGCDVVFASAPAGPDSARAKLEWLERHFGVNRREVFLCHRKDWIEADILIDDKPSTLAKWAQKGRVAMGIRYPYNGSVAGVCHLLAESWQNTENAWSRIVQEVARIRDRRVEMERLAR